jgi:hypothetical protein
MSREHFSICCFDPGAAEHPARATLLIGALGVVFRDIGISRRWSSSRLALSSLRSSDRKPGL